MRRTTPAQRGLSLLTRLHLRLLTRGQPVPECKVALQRGIEVPGEDGVVLLTDHYIPLADGPRPTLLVRSPYERGFPWDSVYGAQFAARGFHVLIQSCRGTGGSGGAFEPWCNERADGRASVAWLRRQDWFNGALGAIGTSYLGYTAWALAAERPPELKTVVADGSVDPHAFFYADGGAFALQDALFAAASMLHAQHGLVAATRAVLRLRRRMKRVATVLPLIAAYPAALGSRMPLFEQWLANPDPAAYWSALDLRNAPVHAPASLITGWDDVQLDQTLERYRQLCDDGIDVTLTIGPWTHTSIFDKGWPMVFPAALRELHTRLAAEPAAPDGTQVRVYVRGSGQWRDLPQWPPPNTRPRPWHLHADGSLRDAPPTRPDASRFHYDPADPTPSRGGRTLANPAGPVDNTSLEARADVLTFTSATLTEAVEILGPVSLRLCLRASSPCHDVFARLCDVDPGGRSRNVCDGLTRRQAGEDTGEDTGEDSGEAMLIIPMSSAAHRFQAGHCIRLQISGGAHPRYARNAGTGEPTATATRLVPVDIELLHKPESPHTLTLPTTDQVDSALPPGDSITIESWPG